MSETPSTPPNPPASPTGPDAAPSHPGSQQPGRPRRKQTFGQRFETWLLYRSWKWLVVALLLVLGLGNLYPFGWMIGTSLKTTSEAAADRARPYPVPKFQLSPEAREIMPRIVASYGEEHDAIAADVDLTPDQRQQRQGQALRDALAEHIDGTLENPIHQGGLLLMLHDEDLTRGERLATFVPYRITLSEFMSNQDIDERDVAREAVDGLIDVGLLRELLVERENYYLVWNELRFYLHFITSLVVTIGVVFVTLIVTSMLGYALARLKFPGKMLVLCLLIGGAVAPSESIIVPIFRLLQSVGLLEGLLGMTLWLAGIGIGHTFLMAGFFMTLPKEVEEAAKIDGAGTFQTFFDVALPMARPIVLTIGLFAFLGAWNEFLIPLLCTMSDPEMQPLAVAVYTFQRGHQGWWPLINAAAAIIIIPVVVLFLILNRHIVRAIAVGAVKG